MATIVPAQQTAIATLYVALFNRAPDAAGFGYWVQALSNGAPLSTITSAFLTSPESKAIYPSSQTSEQFITSFYTTVFGRAPDAAGLAFWAGVVNANGGSSSDAAKAVAVAQIIAVVSTPLTTKPADITDAQYAQTVADRSTFANKVTVGTYYAVDAKGTSVDTAKQVLSGVNTTAASVDAAKAIADTATNVGTTYTGTLGADSFTGTGANDTFNFLVDATTPANSTLTAVDKVSGGAGIDTLNITTVGTVADVLNAADVSGVETIAIRSTGGSASLAVVPTGVTTISVSGAGNVNVNGLATGAKFVIAGAAGSPTYIAGYAAAATTANVSLSGGNVTSGSVSVSGTGLTSITITGSNGVNSVSSFTLTSGIKTVTIDAQSALTTGSITGVAADTAITVTGAGVANIGALAANVASVTATGNTGGLTAALSAATQKITGSAGVDTISTGIALTTGSVDAGAGTADILIITNAAALASAALGAKYTNFEILQAANGVIVDLDSIAGITSVRVADGAGAGNTGFVNMSAAQAAAVTISSTDATGGGFVSLGVKNASAAGQIDTVKAALTTSSTAGVANNIDLSGIVLTGVEKLELTANGTTAANSGTVTFNTAAALSLDSIILKSAGINTITIDGAHTATNLVVDASGSTGNTIINATSYNVSTGATLIGGTGNDILVGSARSDKVVGGAGSDLIAGTTVTGAVAGTATTLATITAITASTAADILTGGDGRDAFAIGKVDAAANISTITDLNLGTAVAAGGVDGLIFDLATPAAAATIVTLTAGQQTAITAAASLTAALDLAATAVNGAANAAATFTYGADTYLIINGVALGTTYVAAEDAVVKITGVTGVLDGSDIVII